MKTKRSGPVVFLDRYFYFGMSLLVAAIVVYGFSHTIGPDYLHASPIPPIILTIHALVFPGWVIFFILQSTLIRIRKVSLHRTLGWFGLALGITLIIVGYLTVIGMDRYFIASYHNTTVPPLLLVQLASLIDFTLFFVLAICYRRRPEFHRRLILLATLMLTFAAFTRFPHLSHILGAWTCVNLMIGLGVLRDLIIDRRVHKVYVYSLIYLFLTEFLLRAIRLHAMPWWTHIANHLLR